MKNINIEEVKRYLKRSLKKKVKITTSLIVLFMMSNSIVSMAEVFFIDDGRIYTGSKSATKKALLAKKDKQLTQSVALNARETGNKDEVANDKVGVGSVAIGYGAEAGGQKVEKGIITYFGSNAVAVGKMAKANADNSVAIGNEAITETAESISIGLQSKVKGDQGVSIGSKSAAVKQSVAIGGDTYALGESSIAIGNDDMGEQDHLPEATIRRIYKGIVTEGIKTDDGLKSAYIDSKQYSPTYAGGKAAIAIGSRTVAAANHSIAMGVLSFALAEGSTAIGRYAFVDENASQGLAVGEKARVFSANSLALGSENESTSEGSMSYGYKAKAVGNGSLAIGNMVASNAEISNKKALQDIFDANINQEEKKKKLKGYVPTYSEINDVKFTLSNKPVKPLQSNGEYGLTLGSNAYSIGDNSMTIGSLSLSEGENSLALGVISYAKGDNSMAIGTESISKANNSMAIGIGAKANLENSLALGNKSITDYQTDWLGKPGYVPEGAISLPSSTNVGVISVGSIGQERRITNVAAGYRDTDAVNVSQLKSVEDKLSAVNLSGYDNSMVNFVSVNKTDGEGKKMQDLAIKMARYKEYIQLKAKLLEMKVRKEKNHEAINDKVKEHIENILKKDKYKSINGKEIQEFKKLETSNEDVKEILKKINEEKDKLIKEENLKKGILTESEQTLFNESNFYNKSTTGKDAVAIGAFATASGSEAIAIGKESLASGNNSIVIGTKNSTTDKEANDKKNDNETSKDILKLTSDESGVAIGHGVDSGKYAVGIGANVISKKASVAIGDRSRALGENSVAIGQGSKVNNIDSVAIGKGSEANTSTAKAYLTDDQNNGGRTFAVGSTNIKRRIAGVADGSADSDAVTVKQLKKLSEKGITFKDDNNKGIAVNLTGEIKISGKEENNHRNISVTTNNKNLEVTLSKTLKGITSIENGNNSAKLTLNNDNISVNSKKITGLADGTINANSTDAVTGKQLEARTKFTIQADEYRENKTKIPDKSFELSLPQKIIFRGASKSEEIEVNGENGKEKKSVPKTYDTTYATENVRTYIEKNENNDYEVIVAFKNKPKFDKVQIGEVGGFVISKDNNGFNFNKKKLGNVAPGRIGDQSGDVVVGDQLKDYVKQIVSSNDDISAIQSDIMDGKNKVGVKYTLGLNQNLKNKINKIDDKADKSELTELGNKQITFIGDTRGAETKDVKVKLGEEIQIKAEDHWNYNKETKAHTDSEPYYATENLSTYYRIKDGKKQILIGMKSKPNFEEINIKREIEKENNKKEYKEAKIGINDEGKVTLTDAQNTTASPIVTEATVGNQKIKYTANDYKTKKETTLTNGFNFSNGTNTEAKIEDNGVVKFNLKDALTGITSIGKGTNGTKITLNENDITVNKKITGLIAGSEDSDAVNMQQLNALKATVTTNTSSIEGNKTEIAKKLNKDDLSITGDTYISVGGTDKKYTLTFNKSELEKNIDLSKNNTINENLNKKANSDATNITDTIWREKLNVYSKTETDNEIKKVKVVGTNDEIDVSPNDKTFIVSLNKTMKEKIDKKANASDLDAYAKKDASNISESDWVTKLGDDSLENGNNLAKSSAVKKLKTELQKQIDSKADKSSMKFKYKTSTPDTGKTSTEQELDLTSTEKTLDFQAGSNLTTEVEKGYIKYALKSGLTGISSISGEDSKSKIELDKDSLKLTHDGASVTIAKDVDKAKISGLKDFDINDKTTAYGQSGVAATQKEVKDVLNKVNSNITEQDKLKNGTLGTVVYTDKDGNKLVKLKDGKYYKAEDVDNNGIVKVGKNYASIDEKDLVLSTVNPDGSTKEPTTKLRIADGSLKEGSKEAVTGGQVYNKLKEYALKDASNIDVTKWVTKLGDDSLENGNNLAKSKAVKEYVDKINSGLENKGLKFNADQGGEQTQKLGSSIKIASATGEISDKNIKYLGKNIKTKITKTGEDSTISLAFSDSPEFSSVKIGDSEIKQTTDGNNKNITINGDTVITTKNILSQTIGYKANSEATKKVSLENGFTFKNTDNITSKANDNGEVSFELNKDLKKISSIESDGTEEAKKTKVTLTENGTEFKTGTDGVTTKIGKDGLEITKGSKTVSITTTDKGGSITGLEDRKVSNSNYGEAGRVATEGAVKEIYDQLNSNNGVSNKLNELRRGLAGSVVYTDKDGNRVARANNGKVYSIEAVDENGKLKVGHSYAKVIEPENVVLSTVNPDGKTTKPITIGNVASALGLSKDKKDNKGILDKLVNKTANPNIYTEKEFNNVVTLRDLQFLASKGITFAGSTGTATKFLGDTITINGKTSDYKDLDKNNNFATKYETKNIAVKVDNTNGNIEVGLAKELKNINSIESNETEKAKITLSKDKGIEFTTGDKGKTVTIKTTDKGGSITGLEEKTVDTNYGTTEGEVATRKEVKTIYDKIKSTSSEVGKVTLTLTTDDNPATEKKVNLKKDKIKYANGINTKATIEQDNTKNLTTVKYDINSELKGIKNISSDSNGNSTKLTLNDNELLINNKKIKGIAKGDLSENSTDAVTGGQVYEIKNKVDKLTTDNYINFAGDNGDDIKLSLADKLSIVGEGNTTPAKTAENNITVDSDKENKKLIVKLAKDLQNIGSVTFKQGDKTTKISIDNSTGDLNITKTGDTKVEKILTTNNIGGQKIYYTSNSDTNKKETTLINGFDFTSEDLEIKTGDNGKVTFNLTDKVKNSLNG
ncbi:hypothetical protein, partial [uncultured Sneathia sp.]|uniref:hypothetical protein n=1 Tax=uncultured Sneathia sp. TaxID=278067 RepID=UPI002592E5E0